MVLSTTSMSLLQISATAPGLLCLLLAAFAAGWGVCTAVRRSIAQSQTRPLIDELRAQLARSQQETAEERAHRMQEAQQAALLTGKAETACAALSEAEARYEKLRLDVAADRERMEARHAKDLADLKTAFAGLSHEVLRGMAPDVTKEVANKVEPLVAQMHTALTAYQAALQQGLSGQSDALTAVREHLLRVSATTDSLANSTRDFTMVLKSGQHRGRWGEQTLRRVLEASGLSPHCDFVEQASQDNTRPDLLISLPGNRCVIVDAKVPEFDAAIADHTAPGRKELVKAHAQKLRSTISALAGRDYPGAQRRAGRTPFEHVVLFLPAESLLSTALEGDTELLLDAGKSGVLLATPATLMGLLAAISITWQQHQQAENGAKIAEEAMTLYGRVGKLMEHIDRLRGELAGAVSGFNSAVGSYERMVRPSADRLRSLAGVGRLSELPALEPVEEDLRALR